MSVKIADKLEQFNNGTYYLVDSSAVEYVDKDGNTKSVKEALDNASTDNSTHKTVIFENNIDMGKYLLLAKITDANYSNNIIKFSCPNYKGSMNVGFKYEDDMDIYKFELHFNTGSMRENNSYGVTLKQHGLGLYSYPLNNPKNTEPRLEEAIRLYWDYSKGEIYVFLVDLMTAIPHCVLEYTGSGTLIRNNTFVNDDLYNRRDGLNGTWEDSKWSSIPYNKLETPPIYELGGNGGSGSTEGTKTYTSLNALGLTSDATVEDVVSALKNGESFLAPVNTFTNYETIFPNRVPNDQWNKIHIIKGTSLASSHIRCFSPSGTFEYLANINNTNIVAWNDVSGTYIDISDSIIEKLGNEILKYPVGKYRINSSATGYKFTDLPSNAEAKCGLIEIDGTAAGKSPFTDAWVYRMYKFECLTGTLSYVRRLNSGATVGQIELDTNWCKVERDIYTSLSELGLTADATFQDVIDKLPKGGSALFGVKDFTNYQTIFPYEEGNDQFARVYIVKGLEDGSCVYARWFRKDGTKEAIAIFNVNDNKFSEWKRTGAGADNGVLITSNIITKYGTEILKYPVGTWRIDNKNIGNQFTDLPLKDMGSVIEISSIDPNRSPYENTYGYRHYIFKASLDGIIYIRTLNSGEIPGTFSRDTGWQKIATQKDLDELFQSVSSGKTLVANAITGKGVSTATDATFATMATNIGKISAYKEETKSLIVTSGTTGTEALKFTFSANVIAVKQITPPSDSCRIVPQTSKVVFTIAGKELIVHVTGSGTWKVTALIQN